MRTALPALLLVALSATACGSTAITSAPTSAPSGPAGSPSPATDAIAHPGGANEIVLRFDEAGGFVPVEFMAGHVPLFTLYGDGTVVFVSSAAASSELAPGGPSAGQPIRTARIAESQIQELLTFALSEGGLANAREHYDNPNVADAPTATFEIHAAGDAKTVSVVALGMDATPGPDSAIKASLVRLADLLRDFDRGGTVASDPYAPKAYRGVLFEMGDVQGVDVRTWPWPQLAPADFQVPAEPNAFQGRTRVLGPEDAAAVGVDGFENGIVGGLYYRGADGVLYSLVIRPLLPDETA